MESSSQLLRIGHKGADAIVPGNTIASFEAAVELGVDIIELDVLRPRGDFREAEAWPRASGGPAAGSGPLLVAHDWGAAARGTPPTLDEALDAFTRPPLEAVRIDLDLKVAGREDEIVAALRERDLLGRAMVSGMEVPGLRWLARKAPEVTLGWTVPRLTKDWRRKPGVALILPAWKAYMQWRLPAKVEREAPELGAWAVWVYHPLITRRLTETAAGSGIAVIAWTVDTAARMRELRDLGVRGIVTNDPRLFSQLEH
ncbi:MAG: glycerophosphodiester phosphodiesterase [Solirubrobacterales bacterium]